MISYLVQRFGMALKVIHFAYLLIVLFPDVGVEAAIGINWGRRNAQRLIPSQVVDLLLQNNVWDVRIYDTQNDVLQAFAGSGIALSVSMFDPSNITSVEAAKAWYNETLAPYPDTKIRNIYIGNYAFWMNKDNQSFMHSVIDSTMYLQNVVKEYGLQDEIKVTIPQSHLILKLNNLTRPSDAEFMDELKEVFGRYLLYLEENDAPFAVDMFPIFTIMLKNFDISFAFADNKSTTVVTDINGFVYTNVFEFTYDSFVWAIKKMGAPNLKIVVAQVGWPTDGYESCNTSMSERFFKSLLPLVASNKGTPMRPGVPIDTFIHSLTDENKNPDVYAFSRHWGIYRSNGEPKFKIDLSGQGRDIYPTRVRGIMRMPQRWCMYNKDDKNLTKVVEKFKFACNASDCTSLAPGGSCGNLDFAGNVSYAFNMYFQFNFQAEEACDFESLGQVVTMDPSIGTCVFQVDVVQGLQRQYVADPNNKL